MAQSVANQDQMLKLEDWVTKALAKSSMGFRTVPKRGWGIRRMLADRDAPLIREKQQYCNAYVVLENQLLNEEGQGVYVANPFYQVPLNISGIGKPGFNGPENLDDVKLYENSPNGVDFKNHRQQHPEVDVKVATTVTRKILALNPGSDQGKMKNPDPAKDNDETYIKWGAQHLSRGALLNSTAQVADFYGLCDNFTCATVAMVVNQDPPPDETSHQDKNTIPHGTTIELVGIEPGDKKIGHILCAANRDTTKSFTDYKHWGDLCFVIDHWYGLQRCTEGTVIKSVYWIKKIATDKAEADYFSFFQGVRRAYPVTFRAASMKGIVAPKFLNVGALTV